MKNVLNELSLEGLDRYAGLLKAGDPAITSWEFADLIREARRESYEYEIAHEFDKITGLIKKNFSDVVAFDPWSERNKYEIAARDAGWRVILDISNTGKNMGGYRVETHNAKRRSGNYLVAGQELPDLKESLAKAWQYAAAHLKLDLDPKPRYDTKTEKIYALMLREIVKNDAVLKFYKRDFYTFDLNHLQDTGASGEYLWLVRESGTHLVTLGVHNRLNEGFRYAVEMRESTPRELFLINAERATILPITEAYAFELLGKLEYQISGSTVMKGNDPIADFEVKTSWSANQQLGGSVRYFPVANANLSLHDLTAMRQIAIEEVVVKASSLFTKTKEILVSQDGVYVPINKLIDAATVAENEHEAQHVTWYGTITGDEKDRDLLLSLGVKIGDFDYKNSEYTVKVSADALKALDGYWGTFMWGLQGLSHTILPDTGNHFHAEEIIVPMASLQPSEMGAYCSYLRYTSHVIVTNHMPIGARTIETNLANCAALLEKTEEALRIKPLPSASNTQSLELT